MGATFEYAVSLQVRHPTAPADELAAAFPWPMTSSWNAGDASATPKGRALGGIRSESYCSLKVANGHDAGLAACLAQAVDLISADDKRWVDFRQTGGRLSFYVFWYPDGDTGALFDAGLLGKMAALGIDLGLNVYEDQSRDG